jgi:hypothetical protein
MKPDSTHSTDESHDSQQGQYQAASSHARTLLATGVLLLILISAYGFWRHFSATADEPETNKDAVAAENAPGSVTSSEPIKTAANRETPSAAVTRPGFSRAAEPSAQTRQLVQSLAAITPGVPLTPERASDWRKAFQALLDQGPASVPAIREFLEKNTDASFGAGADQLVGYRSVRSAMIDALRQISGPEASEVAMQTLRSVTEPRELASLTQALEKLAPDQFKEEALQAARQMLAQSAASPTDNGQDVAAAFQVLQRYGGEGAVQDLERASAKWGYYSALALAQLPDGAGIPSLIHMLDPQNGLGADLKDPALRMLAQESFQYPEAREALMNEARQNRIPVNSWVALAPILAGEQVAFLDSGFNSPPAPGTPDLKTTHLAYGNQNLFSLPTAQSMTPDQMAQRLDLIQQMVPSASDPAAAQALRASYDQLTQRLAQPPASPPAN